MPQPSKKTSKLLNVLWRKQQAGNIHVYKNEINNSLKSKNFLANLFILKYLLFSLFGPTKKKKYTHTYIHKPFVSLAYLASLHELLRYNTIEYIYGYYFTLMEVIRIDGNHPQVGFQINQL